MTTARFSTSVLLGILGCAVLAPIPAGAAQGGDKSPRLYFKYDPKADFVTTKALDLRPNVDQTIYLYVYNPSPLLIRNVSVRLFKIEDNGAETLINQGVVEKVEKEKAALIQFPGAKPPPPPAEEKKGEKKEEAKQPAPGIELAGPPFELLVKFEWTQEEKKLEVQELLQVQIQEPQAYVQVPVASYKQKPETVTFELEAARTIYGPPCQANLVVTPETVPGLKPVKTLGNYKQIIPPQPGTRVPLRGVDLQFFTPAPPEFGRFYITVDGYDRAFMFWNSFTKGAPQPLVGYPTEKVSRLRIFAPRYTVPGPKTPVQLEVDFPPTALTRIDAKTRPLPLLVRLDLDLDGSGNYQTVKEFKGHRQQQVIVNPAAPAGGLSLKTIVRDWTTEIDTSDVFGLHKLRAQLLQPVFDKDQKIWEYRPVVLVKEQEIDHEKLLIFEPGNRLSQYAPLSYGELKKVAVSVLADVLLDSTPPKIIDFGSNLENVGPGFGTQVRNADVIVKAQVEDRFPDSTIKKVVFFVGKLTPKGEIAPDAVLVPGLPVAKEGPGVFFARLPVPTDKAGTFDIGVQATNGAGLTESRTITLKLIDAPAGGKGAPIAGAKVIGKVLVGGRGQPGVPVVLSEPNKGEIKAAAKTDKDGVFVFVGVAPGPYSVSASNPALKLRGTTLIQVPPDVEEVKGVTINMVR